MPGPLEGVKVVEFSEIIAAPLAGMLLADMGAEVVKVEPPWGEPWRYVQSFLPTESRQFMAYNRGKRSLPLDLTCAESRDILGRLIPRTDVVLVNYRPDVAARLGMDYQTLAGLNPRLIYAEATAFGRNGQDAQRPGYDLIVQAMSGLMTAEGKVEDGVPRHIWSTPLVDTTSGISLAWAVCGALYSRERTGEGQKVETTLLGSALGLLGMRFVSVESLDAEARTQTLEEIAALRAASLPYEELLTYYQSQHPPSVTGIYYRMYRTSDGAVAVGCLSDRLRLRLLEVLGLHDIRFDPGYDPTTPEAAAFESRLVQDAERAFQEKTTAEWLSILEGRGIPAGPVRFVDEMFDDPQVEANGLVAEVEHRDAGKVRMAGPLARFSGTPLESGRLAALGEHTFEVLRELGYNEEEVEGWRQRGVVA